MVLDFGFLKDAMLSVIDKSIDHGFVACVEDHELLRHFLPEQENASDVLVLVRSSLRETGYWLSTDHLDEVRTLLDSKLYVIPYIPTSERLAEHFFTRLKDPIRQESNGVGELTNLRFWETPNCYSDFPGFAHNDS